MKKILALGTIVVVVFLALMAYSNDVAENNVETEATETETEFVEETEYAEEVLDVEEVIETVELPFYSYEEFIEATGLSEEEYDMVRMYGDYEKGITSGIFTPTESYLSIMELVEEYRLKEETVEAEKPADKENSSSNKDNSTQGGSSSSGQSGSSTGGQSSSSVGRIPSSDQELTPEEAAALRNQHNIESGGMSSEELANGYQPERTDEEKAVMDSLRGY